MDISNNHHTFHNIPANAMDKASERKRFENEFEKNTAELAIEEQVTAPKEVEEDLLKKIHHLKTQLLMAPRTVSEATVDLLNQKIMSLIKLINQTNSPETKTALTEIFSSIETPLFKQQVALINRHLNKA